MEQQNFWRKCSSCKKEIGLSTKYYECSVSTCTGQRTGYVFCSIPCWEVHLPGARHRDAGAIEKKSPAVAEASRTSANSCGSATAASYYCEFKSDFIGSFAESTGGVKKVRNGQRGLSGGIKDETVHS